ncbi:cytochrome P450 CYP749A22-like [Ziziphus jujuba]|uniref:Cytochrome P450 CYP749A22-like n=1 Tax=Ziziphus jujuba TaxID=326968 RepID=A0ABM3ZXB8_ZIZJJ|nr:cytochrome P450 CYP749A22-like [Ziziphus jujuba]
MAKPTGLSHAIFSKCQPHIESWLKTYDYLQWYGAKAQLIVTEQELIKELLYNKDRSVSKIDIEGFAKKLLGDGLVATKGEKWAKLRKLANYAIHGESLKGMVPAMISSVEMMLQRWKSYEGKEVEVYEEFRLLTSEVISRTAFGSNYLRGKDLFEMLMRLAWLLTKNMYKLKLPGIT